jgi:hypothetical protein
MTHGEQSSKSHMLGVRVTLALGAAVQHAVPSQTISLLASPPAQHGRESVQWLQTQDAWRDRAKRVENGACDRRSAHLRSLKESRVATMLIDR